MSYASTKTYGHEVGLSVAFRQHRATHSHCSKLHGYAIAVKLTFASVGLDDNNWVMDFGNLKPVKQFLVDNFDHKLILAEDDPILKDGAFYVLDRIADVVILPAVGCEKFAEYIYDWVDNWLVNNSTHSVILESVEVKEHGANSAIYRRNV